MRERPVRSRQVMGFFSELMPFSTFKFIVILTLEVGQLHL